MGVGGSRVGSVVTPNCPRFDPRTRNYSLSSKPNDSFIKDHRLKKCFMPGQLPLGASKSKFLKVPRVYFPESL